MTGEGGGHGMGKIHYSLCENKKLRTAERIKFVFQFETHYIITTLQLYIV